MKSNDCVKMIINKNAFLKGDLTSASSIQIDGIFKGNISSTQNVYVGSCAKIVGNIEAQNIIINGSVKGNIIAKSKVHLSTSSSLEGEIITNMFHVEDGASFVGKCAKFKPIAS